MTGPPTRRTERRHSAPNGPGLFVTDAELSDLLGIPADVLKYKLTELDMKASGFPRKLPFWENRRYWPAVKNWLDRSNGLGIGAEARPAPHARVAPISMGARK